jgi:hypothetical protein
MRAEQLDPDAPPTEEELIESERLRQALEDGTSTHPDAELARALRHAIDPRPLDELTHRRILDRAVPRRQWYRRPEIFVGFAAAAAIVIAATSLQRPTAPAASLVTPHTTQALFNEPFAREGETSKRMDAIVASRNRDLRANRYARWGVK